MAKAYNVRLVSHVQATYEQMSRNIGRAMTAVGTEAVGLILDNMEHGYHDVHYRWVRQNGRYVPTDPHTAIRDTSNLMGDVSFDTSIPTKTIRIGNSLPYAVYVHEGTSRVKGRPYIVDGITRNIDRLEDVYSAYLRDGF